jgi:crotonobetainyl-CoA:carnitine CoA-transferase CaiB-like acyl-CoA transferase
MALIGGAGIPAGAALDTMELQNDPSFVERGIMQTMEHPVPPANPTEEPEMTGRQRR